MNLPPFEHLPNAHQGQTITHINYLNGIFLHATCSSHALVTLHTVRWIIFRQTAASVDSNAQTFQKTILSQLSVSKYDSTPSPTAISVPVAVYNFGRLCVQWCQNPDGRVAMGLCAVCTLAPLDTSHNTRRLHWTQLHWVTEDSAFVKIWMNVTDRTVSTACLVQLMDILWHGLFDLTQMYIALLSWQWAVACSSVSQNMNTSGIYCMSLNWKNHWSWHHGAETCRRLIIFTNFILLVALTLMF